MSRVALLVAVLLLLFTGLVQGHSINLVARAALTAPDSLTVQLLDLYANPASGAQVTVRAAVPPQSPGRPVTLPEGPPGTYTGQVRTGGASEVAIAIEAIINGERFDANFRLKADEGGKEITRAMMPVDLPPQGFNWRLLLYGAALAVLAVGALTALRRRPKPDQP